MGENLQREFSPLIPMMTRSLPAVTRLCAAIAPFVLTTALLGQIQVESYTDNTWQQKSTNGGWLGGDGSAYGGAYWDTSKINVTWNSNDLSVKIDLYSNFFSNSSNFLADLFFDLDKNGTFETAIAMSDHGKSHSSSWGWVTKGSMFTGLTNSSTATSDELMGSSAHATAWKDTDFLSNAVQNDPAVWLYKPTSYGATAYSATTAVSRTTIDTDGGSYDSNPNYRYTVEISGLTVSQFDDWRDFGMFWGTATCANDSFYVDATLFSDTPEIPEPSTYGALGVAGLIGLVWWRRRRR